MKRKLLLLFLLGCATVQAQFWTEVAPFSTNAENMSPMQISLVSDQILWTRVFQNNNTVWCRSTDCGNTWQTGNFSLGNPNLMITQIEAISATKAYVIAYSSNPVISGGVWVTEDGGQTWNKQITAFSSSSSPFPNFIHFFDTNNGLVMGDAQNGIDFEIFTTSDGGSNWNLVDPNNIPNIGTDEYGYTSIYEARENSLWFGTNKGRIFKSDDQGAHWTVFQSPIYDFDQSETGGRFAFKNSNDGLLTTRNGNLWETHNGGQTWNLLTSGMNNDRCYNYGIEYVPNTNNAYFGWGEIYNTAQRSSSYTLDGGNSWQNLTDEIPNVEITVNPKFLSGSVGYCIGYVYDGSGVTQKVYKLTDPLNRLNGALATTPFEKDKTEISPNPTQGLVRVLGNNINAISLIDLSGKTIKSLSYIPTDKIDLDITSLENGMYLIKIYDTSGKVSTEKIIKN